MIYRVIKPLTTGKEMNALIHPGSNIRDNFFKPHVLEALINVGAIAPVSAPPLDVFQGWKLRGKRFIEAGYDAISLLETPDEEIVTDTGYHIRSIRKWKKELEGLLLIGEVKISKGCQGCSQEQQEVT